LLSELYVDTRETAFIYNQGRCFEQNRRYEDAIARFQEYLRVAKKESNAVRTEAERHIAECKALLAEERAQKAEPAPVPRPGVTTGPTAALTSTPVITAPVPMEKDPESAKRIVGIVVGSVGLASLATAVILNLKANRLASDVNDREDSSKRSSQPSYKTGALVFYGIGGAALLTGGVLYWLGYRSQKTNAVAILPIWTPGTAGLAVHREF
jgi:hypothetical protein